MDLFPRMVNLGKKSPKNNMHDLPLWCLQSYSLQNLIHFVCLFFKHGLWWKYRYHKNHSQWSLGDDSEGTSTCAGMRTWSWVLRSHVKCWAWLHTPAHPALGGRDRWILDAHWSDRLTRTVNFGGQEYNEESRKSLTICTGLCTHMCVGTQTWAPTCMYHTQPLHSKKT